MNPVLSAINFWRIAEKVVTFFTGWIPRGIILPENGFIAEFRNYICIGLSQYSLIVEF